MKKTVTVMLIAALALTLFGCGKEYVSVSAYESQMTAQEAVEDFTENYCVSCLVLMTEEQACTEFSNLVSLDKIIADKKSVTIGEAETALKRIFESVIESFNDEQEAYSISAAIISDANILYVKIEPEETADGGSACLIDYIREEVIASGGKSENPAA